MTNQGSQGGSDRSSQGTFERFETNFTFDDLPPETRRAIKDEISQNAIKELPVEEILREVVKSEIDEHNDKLNINTSEHFEKEIHLPITLGVGIGLVVGGSALLVVNQLITGTLILLLGLFSLFVANRIKDKNDISVLELI